MIHPFLNSFTVIFVHFMETIINKVAESGIITIDLTQFLPTEIMVFDLKNFLFMELILKEKDFRASLLQYDWSEFANREVAIFCSADAIIPVWAYMLVANYLEPVAHDIVLANPEEARKHFLLKKINNLDTQPYVDKRLVIKGCGDVPIPEAAYAAITFKLKPVAKSILYGEPCSTVPIYKKKTTL